MNYQLLLECYSSGTYLTKDELQMLDIELDSQLESIKVSATQGCLQSAPKSICDAAFVCESSFWITCLAAVLDKCSPRPLGFKAKGAIVFDELVSQGYVVSD